MKLENTHVFLTIWLRQYTFKIKADSGVSCLINVISMLVQLLAHSNGKKSQFAEVWS